MREVVIPQDPGGENKYLSLLADAFEAKGWTVVFDANALEKEPPPICWIQWPEAFSDGKPPTDAQVERVAQWLKRGAEKETLFVWTVHNLIAHGGEVFPNCYRMYQLVAEHAHIQVHHGKASVDLVREKYPAAEPQEVVVAPIGRYDIYVGSKSKEEARDVLGLSGSKRVLLAFGRLRFPRELSLLMAAATAPGWTVLFAGRFYTPYGRKERFLFPVKRVLANSVLTFNEGFVSDDRVDFYFKACDAVLVPRLEILNSTSLPMAFTFGRACLGPNTGNVGQWLKDSGNFVFDPRSVWSIRHALASMKKVDLAHVGQQNDCRSRQCEDWDHLSEVVTSVLERSTREFFDPSFRSNEG